MNIDRKTAAELLRDPNTLGTTLLVILLATYGEQIFEMDPVELWVNVQDDFHATVSEEGENRVNALMLALSTESFYEDPEVFRAVCTSLYDGDLGDLVGGSLEDLTLCEVLWAMHEVGNLRDDEPEFSPAVARLIGELIAEEAEDSSESPVPGYEQFLDEAKRDLIGQLLKLGVDKQDLMLLD